MLRVKSDFSPGLLFHSPLPLLSFSCSPSHSIQVARGPLLPIWSFCPLQHTHTHTHPYSQQLGLFPLSGLGPWGPLAYWRNQESAPVTMGPDAVAVALVAGMNPAAWPSGRGPVSPAKKKAGDSGLGGYWDTAAPMEASPLDLICFLNASTAFSTAHSHSPHSKKFYPSGTGHGMKIENCKEVRGCFLPQEE